MAEPTRVTLSVTTDDLSIIARTAERFAATLAGLSAEGVRGMLMIGPEDDEETL